MRIHMRPSRPALSNLTTFLITLLLALAAVWVREVLASENGSSFDSQISAYGQQLTAEGKQTFRFDTFGSEGFWSDALKINQAIEGANLGGVGPGVSPKTALSVGLKVDVEALPPEVVAAIGAGKVNLDDPATTLTLLKLNSVVGLKGTFSTNGRLKSLGITCAVCHSTVDNSVTTGIGRRLDGWANRDLNVGAIISLSPDLSPVNQLLGVDDATTRKVLSSWGPGKFDAELFMDGKGFRPDGKSAATLIPPAFGLAGVNLHTWTGWGSIPHWNAFVSNLEMHGRGRFYDPRLNDPVKFPIAAKNGFADVHADPDLTTSKLPALQMYQLSIPAPKPPEGTFDRDSATRGAALFKGKANCASCHVPPLFTEPGWNLHRAQEIGIDDFQAQRSPAVFIAGQEVVGYRTAPLKGLWTHQTGGFYHDGRFATLQDVVTHYNDFLKLGLSSAEMTDLVQYLNSLGDDVAPLPGQAPPGSAAPAAPTVAVASPPTASSGNVPGMPRTGQSDTALLVLLALAAAGAVSGTLALRSRHRSARNR